jgi:hypothetical protein
MVRRWGDGRATALAQRLQELDAADCLGDVADLPYVAVTTGRANSNIEIRDTEDLVIVCRASIGRGEIPKGGSWRALTALTIADVNVSVTSKKKEPDQ